MLRALDLCAGAGGLSLGLQRAGYDVTGVELDPVAAEWHRAHVGPCVTESIATYATGGGVMGGEATKSATGTRT